MNKTSVPDKSVLFQTYNHLRGQGAEAGRLNKALGLVQSRRTQAERPYQTTATSCTCPDHLIRGVTCKHMLAAKMAQPEIRVCETCGQEFTPNPRTPAQRYCKPKCSPALYPELHESVNESEEDVNVLLGLS